MTSSGGAILFTAFEPSGDDLAASVIRSLVRRRPDLTVYAYGGAGMERAGSTIIERTGDDAVVGLPGPGKILEHIRMNRRIASWMDQHDIGLHVPVDSPAANFPICALSRARGIPIAHLAAPQLWAWAPWRIRKLRRLTDHVMCLLPFEEDWFRRRGVEATFVGHPLFDEPTPEADDPPGARGALRLGVMPGSRPKELSRHLPLILRVLRSLRAEWPDLAIRFAVQNERAAQRVRDLSDRRGGMPDGVAIETGEDAVSRTAAWADVCLTKSGTVTLHITRRRTPMVVLYRTTTLGYLLVGRWLISTPDRAMPNLIAGRRIIDEFIPHVGSPAPIARAVARLLRDPQRRERVRRELDDVAARFEGRTAAEAAAGVIDSLIGERRGEG